MSKRSAVKTKRKRAEQAGNEDPRTRASTLTASGRAERDRAKWRKKRSERLQSSLAEAELAKRRAEQQKADFRRKYARAEKTRSEACLVQKSFEIIMGDYKGTRNVTKVQLATQSSDFIQTQHHRKSQLNELTDRYRDSESHVTTIELEVSKICKFRSDVDQDLNGNWLMRIWKYIW